MRKDLSPEAWRTDHLEKYVLWSLLTLEVLGIVIFNLTRLPNIVTGDFSALLQTSVEMWRQKRLFLQDWSYQSGLFLDTPAPLAALFYGLTGDIFRAFGLANIVSFALFLASAFYFFKPLSLSTVGKLLSGVMFLLPYSVGMLGYAPIIFWGPCFYLYRVILLLLTVGLMLRLYQKQSIAKQIGPALLILLLLFIFTISCGAAIFTLLFVPLAAYELFCIIKENDWRFYRRRTFIFLGISGLIFAGGIISAKMSAAPLFVQRLRLTILPEFSTNCFGYVLGIFDLFGGIPFNEEVGVASFMSLSFISRFFFVVLIFAAFVSVLRDKNVEGNNRILTNLAAGIFLVNGLLMLLVFTKYGTKLFEERYHLVPITLLFISLGLLVDRLRVKGRELKYFGLMFFLFLVFLATIIDRYSILIGTDRHLAELRSGISRLVANGCHDTYTLDEASLMDGRLMRTYDQRVNFISTNNGKEGIGWGASTKFFDASAAPEAACVLAVPSQWDEKPLYLKKHAKLLERVAGYDLYKLQNLKIDLTVELPRQGETHIDLPFSEGYHSENGKLQESGTIRSSGEAGFLLYGPYAETKEGVYDIEFLYHVVAAPEGSLGTFDIAVNNGKKKLREIEIPLKQQRARITDVQLPASERVEFRAKVNAGTIVELQQILIARH